MIKKEHVLKTIEGIVVQNINITVFEENFVDYICITDIAKAKVGGSRGADI